MSLGSHQRKFTIAIAQLVVFAYSKGYELTYGDAFRSDQVPYGHKNSCHKKRLAVDFNIFLDGHYLIGEEANEAHGILHDFWDNIGGSKRIKRDMNHYSFSWQGMR